MIKPGYHKVAVEMVRDWRTATATDEDKSICMYCDEDGTTKCTHSCGTYLVWVNTSTLAQITLELS